MHFFSGSTVTSDALFNADALVVRSTTQVTEALLDSSTKLGFVGTGTAGTNHIDLDYLNSRNIPVHNAGGSNAIAVVEYVLCAMLFMSAKKDIDLLSQKVGIVGVGHIGSLLDKRLQAMGIETCLYDPPLQEIGRDQGISHRWSEFEDIMQCDWITLHVPLIKEGSHPTWHMFDEAQLSRLSEQQCLINACRGEVVDNQALLTLKKQGHQFGLVLDVWEQEPDILFELVEYADIATGHIAGHTLEGKGRGTAMMYSALCHQLEQVPKLTLNQFLPIVNNKLLSFSTGNNQIQNLLDLVSKVYDIEYDNQHFKSSVKNADDFRRYRKIYAARREFSSFSVEANSLIDPQIIQGLGFGKT